LKNGYKEILLNTHCRHKDNVYTGHKISDTTKLEFYPCRDYWYLFDGMCFKDGELIFIQIQTDAWTSRSKYEAFVKTHKIQCIDMNVHKTGKIEVRTFKYADD
jgi:hypothetical protein